MADPTIRALTTLCRMRRMETDAARRLLGEALAREAVLSDRDAAMLRELDAARQVTGDFDRESFAAFLGRKMAERALLAGAIRDAEARTALARTALANRRVAETAAEEERARQVLARDAAAAKREQVILEDVARTLKRSPEG